MQSLLCRFVARRRHAPEPHAGVSGHVRRYQVEPDKVGFDDIVVAQQNLATALQAYLQALDPQWKAVVDTAEISQVDERYPTPAK